MDYSIIFSGKKKNKNKKFAACWFAAKTKQFYGQGRKLSKADIENLDIDSICDDIKDIIPADNIEILYVPYNLTLGALKILEKQLDFFEEKCQDTVLALQKPKQSNKLSKKKANKSNNNNKLNNDDWYNKEIEDVDLGPLFRTPEEKHLITEAEYPLPINPLHELYFDDVEQMTNNIDTDFSVRVGPSGIFEELCDLNAGTSNETPKRKSRKSFEETPSKRRRKDTNSGPSLSKTADATSTTEQVSGGRLSTPLHPNRVRKSLTFPCPDAPQESTAVHDEEVIEEGPPEDLAVPLQNVPIVADVPEETMDQSVPPDAEINAFPQTVVSEERPTDNTVVHNVQNTGIDNIQEPAPTLQKNQEDDVEKTFSLPELDDSLIHQRRRKRNRRFIFSDEIKKIDIRKNLEDPNNPYIHVADPFKNVKNKKLPVMTLLSLPSVRLHPRPYRNGIDCCWGKSLISLFLKMTEKPCTSSEDETGYGELPRSQGTLNNERRSAFAVQGRPSASHTSDLAKSVQQSQPDTYMNADDEPGYQDTMLMPPPLQPPFENEQPQTTEREREAQPSSIVGQKLPRTASALLDEHLISTAAISPRQSGRSSGAGLPQHEPQHASESPSAAPLITDVARSQRSLSSTPDNFSTNDSESMRLERMKYFMSKDEFDNFLEKIWNVLRNRSTYKRLKFNLTAILVPGESACEEVIVYFNYLCVFERQRKLLIKQDKSYGTVTIVKND